MLSIFKKNILLIAVFIEYKKKFCIVFLCSFCSLLYIYIFIEFCCHFLPCVVDKDYTVHNQGLSQKQIVLHKLIHNPCWPENGWLFWKIIQSVEFDFLTTKAYLKKPKISILFLIILHIYIIIFLNK